MRFLSTLKIIYSRNALIKLENGLLACIQPLKRENLDSDLGNLAERIQKTLTSRNIIRTGKTSGKPQEIKDFILKTTFKIAVERKWLFCMPKYEKGVYKFTMNPGFFDRQETAKRLQAG